MLALLAGCLLAQGQTPAQRIAARDFPSIFQAWSEVENIPKEDPVASIARHDLYFTGPEGLKLRWAGPHHGTSTQFEPGSIASGLALRTELLRRNPNLVMVAEVRYRDAYEQYLPKDHPWWKRKDGKREVGWAEGNYYLLDFGNPALRRSVAAQAKAIIQSGVADGVMLDWWLDDADRIALIREVRAAIGPEALILVNANDRQIPLSAPYVNGVFMECYRSSTAQDWARIGDTLRWAEANLRAPRINCVESWFHHSRGDLHLMRSITTLTLTMSDGYALFGDPNDLPTPDHRHDWYPFWDAKLGKPEAAGFRRADGAWERAYSRGTAIHNPMGNPSVQVRFREERTRVSDGKRGREFTVPAPDGDLFLR